MLLLVSGLFLVSTLIVLAVLIVQRGVRVLTTAARIEGCEAGYSTGYGAGMQNSIAEANGRYVAGCIDGGCDLRADIVAGRVTAPAVRVAAPVTLLLTDTHSVCWVCKRTVDAVSLEGVCYACKLAAYARSCTNCPLESEACSNGYSCAKDKLCCVCRCVCDPSPEPESGMCYSCLMGLQEEPSALELAEQARWNEEQAAFYGVDKASWDAQAEHEEWLERMQDEYAQNVAHAHREDIEFC